MTNAVPELLKTVAKSFFYVVTRTAGFFVVGLALNVILLVLLWPEMREVIGPGGGGFGGGGGGSVIALVLVFVYWPITLMFFGFGTVFPFFYFILGLRHGVIKAPQRAMKDNSDAIQGYAMNGLWEFIAKQSGLGEGGAVSVSRSRALELLPAYMKNLEDVPWPMRFIAMRYLNKIDFGGIVAGALQQQDANAPIDLGAIASAVKQRADEKVEATFSEPGLRWFRFLLAVNVTAFAAVKVAL